MTRACESPHRPKKNNLMDARERRPVSCCFQQVQTEACKSRPVSFRSTGCCCRAGYRTRWRSSNENFLFEVDNVVVLLDVCGGTQVPMPSIVLSAGSRPAQVYRKPWPQAKISRSACQALRGKNTSRTCGGPDSTVIAATSLDLCS